MDHEWELNRENIRPLRGGRRVQAINSIFAGKKVDISEAEKRFEKGFKEAQQSKDPLDFCVTYIVWFEENFPTGKQSHLISMLTKMINTFGYREQYLNDRRMLKLWIKLAENKTDIASTILFERAYTAGCCRELAEFYVKWSELREDRGDVSGARHALALGRENHAEPLTLLNDAADALEMRQLRISVNRKNSESNDEDEDDDLTAVRVALGGLTGLGKNQVTPAVRQPAEVAKGLNMKQDSWRKATPLSAKKANGFYIYESPECDGDHDDVNALVPKDFGDTLAHIELAENTFEPSKWIEARIDGLGKISGQPTRSFDVYMECKKPVTKCDLKKSKKSTAILMIADRDNSIEENYATRLREAHLID